MYAHQTDLRKPTISYYNSQVAKKIHSKRDSSPQYHTTIPKLPKKSIVISYYNSQVAKKIHSKRDSSKNHLILQYIKHKLISIEKEEKEIEKCV